MCHFNCIEYVYIRFDLLYIYGPVEQLCEMRGNNVISGGNNMKYYGLCAELGGMYVVFIKMVVMKDKYDAVYVYLFILHINEKINNLNSQLNLI